MRGDVCHRGTGPLLSFILASAVFVAAVVLSGCGAGRLTLGNTANGPADWTWGPAPCKPAEPTAPK